MKRTEFTKKEFTAAKKAYDECCEEAEHMMLSLAESIRDKMLQMYILGFILGARQSK